MRTRFPLLFAGCIAAAAVVLLAWLGNNAEPVSSLRSATARASEVVVRSSASDSTWMVGNPFARLSCELGNGERFKSSACNPDAELPSQIDSDRPEVAADQALAKIEANEFDKLHVLLASLSECWFIHAESRIQQAPGGVRVRPVCNFSQVERVVATAESVLLKASSKGDYVAREGYVDLLLAKIMLRQSQLQLIDPQSEDPTVAGDFGRLESEIDVIRRQITKFVGSLRDPSVELIETSNTLTALLGTGLQESNGGQSGR